MKFLNNYRSGVLKALKVTLFIKVHLMSLKKKN